MTQNIETMIYHDQTYLHLKKPFRRPYTMVNSNSLCFIFQLLKTYAFLVDLKKRKEKKKAIPILCKLLGSQIS